MSKSSKPTKATTGSEVQAPPKGSSVKASPARPIPKAPIAKSSSKPKADERLIAIDRPTRTSGSSTKLDEIIAMLRMKQGASIVQIAQAVDWQRHSVHGLISGNIRKKQGLNVVNEMVDGVRIYRIVK